MVKILVANGRGGLTALRAKDERAARKYVRLLAERGLKVKRIVGR